MITMLVVDDEYLVRVGINKSIEWEKYGIEIIGEACDGEEGFEMALKHHPDIIITDIRMPYMDGLEFISKIRENNIESSIIILSGYDQFEYARSAISNGVSAYVLKPLELEGFIAIVQEIARKIKETRSIKQYQESLIQEIPSIKKVFLNDLLFGNITDKNEIVKRISFLDVPLYSDNNTVIVIKSDKQEPVSRQPTIEGLRNFRDAIGRYITKELLLHNEFTGVTIDIDTDEKVVVLHSHGPIENTIKTIKKQCKNIIEQLDHSFDQTVSIGISGLCNELACINLAYRSALAACGIKLLSNKSSVACMEDIKDANFRREIGMTIKFIKENYHKNINVDIASKELFLSASYLMHIFKDEVGVTFNEYLTDYRIRVARELLSDTRYKIYEIAEMTGYKDVRYFSQIFKKMIGISPSDYLKQICIEKDSI